MKEKIMRKMRDGSDKREIQVKGREKIVDNDEDKVMVCMDDKERRVKGWRKKYQSGDRKMSEKTIREN